MDSSTWNEIELTLCHLHGVRLVRFTGPSSSSVAGQCKIRPVTDHAEIKTQLFKLIKSHGLDMNVSCQTDNEGSEVPSGKSSVFIRTWCVLGQIACCSKFVLLFSEARSYFARI